MWYACNKHLIQIFFVNYILKPKVMKLNLLLLTLFTLFISSCDLIEGIFAAGFWAGIIVVVLVIVIIVWLIKKFLS